MHDVAGVVGLLLTADAPPAADAQRSIDRSAAALHVLTHIKALSRHQGGMGAQADRPTVRSAVLHGFRARLSVVPHLLTLSCCCTAGMGSQQKPRSGRTAPSPGSCCGLWPPCRRRCRAPAVRQASAARQLQHNWTLRQRRTKSLMPCCRCVAFLKHPAHRSLSVDM